MYNGQKIKDLIEAKKVSAKEIYCKAGISKPTFDTMVKEDGNPTARNLEALANALECPIDYFFDRETYINTNIGHHVNGNGNKVSGDITLSECKKEIQHLQELLAEKERTIQILMNK